MRRDLIDCLSDIVAISVPLSEKASNVKLARLLKKEVRDAFFEIFANVAQRLAGPSSGR